jgi:hypothetical protein
MIPLHENNFLPFSIRILHYPSPYYPSIEYSLTQIPSLGKGHPTFLFPLATPKYNNGGRIDWNFLEIPLMQKNI